MGVVGLAVELPSQKVGNVRVNARVNVIDPDEVSGGPGSDEMPQLQ
jgi:hypothetical protein